MAAQPHVIKVQVLGQWTVFRAFSTKKDAVKGFQIWKKQLSQPIKLEKA